MQANFEEVDREVTHARARAFQKAAGARWRQLAAAPLITTTMTPSGAVNEPTRQAYRLTSADEGWSALLNPGSVTLETKTYPGWKGMKEVIQELTQAIADVYDPSSELRLGLRYIDQIPLPPESQDWRELIPEHLLGLSLDDKLGNSVLASDQRFLLQLDEEHRCLFRHGLLADEKGEFGKYYLLDYDAFRENHGLFDAGAIEDALETLHDFAGRLFKVSVTNKLYEWLKG